LAAGLPLFALAGAGEAGPDAAADLRALREGVADLRGAPGAVPGAMAALGPRAFVVYAGRQDRRSLPAVVAARAGSGRVLAAGHEAYFTAEAVRRPGNARFLANALAWLGGRPVGQVRVAQVGGDAGPFREAGARVTAAAVADLTAGGLRDADVLALDQGALSGEAHAAARERVTAFVRRGGGLLAYGPAWGWLQLNPGRSLASDHGGNRLLVPLGAAWTDGSLGATTTTETDGLHAGAALEALRGHAAGQRLGTAELAAAVQVIGLAAGSVPPDDPGFGRPLRTLMAAQNQGPVVPTRQSPAALATPFRRLQIVLDGQDYRAGGPLAERAHPAAADFPGAVPAGAARVTRTLTVDLEGRGWQSTGLYAVAGEPVTVRLAGGGPRGLAVRIGTHTDTLWHLNRWERFPEVSRSWPLEGRETRVVSPFGGAVLLDVGDRGARPRGKLEVTVEGAVEAPLFVRGVTTAAQWRRARNAPGPWAEMQGNTIVLSVPSSVVRTLENPEAVMAYWDELSALAREIYAEPQPRVRRERFCVDRQISAGYMHAGYPIMTGDDVAARFVDLSVLRGRQGGGVWGFYHELGHNYQKPEWTFDGTGEVTCNLLSLYACEKLNGVMEGAHDALRTADLEARIRRHLAEGAPYEKWKSEPFLALAMYIQLRREFGWEPFKKVFAEYRDLPATERPRTDDARRDQWLVRMSRATGRNLGPFFERWGVPTSEGARRSVADLPRWLPPILR